MCKEETGVQYKNAVEYLLSIPKFTKKNSLDHTKELLGTLGNPQDHRPFLPDIRSAILQNITAASVEQPVAIKAGPVTAAGSAE